MSFKIKDNELLQYINEVNETKVVIPKGITSIGEKAFYYCSNLTSITLPDSVTSIGYGAIEGCKKLKKVYINSLSSWCNINFEDRSSNPLSLGAELVINGKPLENDLIIPKDVTKIGNFAFCGADITSVTISNSVTSIGNGAFNRCNNLISITIPNRVISIGHSAFSFCNKLKKVQINSLSSWCNIEFKDFYSNPLLNGAELYVNDELVKDLIIPEDITMIGKYTFLGADITSVTIPDSVTGIGFCAFNSCDNLTSITLPDSVTSIGEDAFGSCENLTSVTLPNSVTSIGKNAFEKCRNLISVTVSSGVKIIDEFSLDSRCNLTSITLPDTDSEISIGEGVFEKCEKLISVTIPDSVTSIRKDVFQGCDKFKNLCVSSNMKKMNGIKLEENKIAKLAEIQGFIDEWIDFEKYNLKADVPLYPLCSFSDLTITQEEKAAYLPELLIKCEENPQYYISYAAFADDDTVRELIKSISVWSKGKKKDKERAFRVKGGLLLNDSIEAMKYADSINMLDHYAEIRHIDVDTLRDNVISNFGLDENGCISWNVDNHIITAKLLNDLTFLLRDETGKVIKSISKKTLEGEEASKAYSALKKEIKRVAKLRNDKLLSDFLSGREREVESWSKAWLNNPLLKVLGRLVVWSQDKQTFTIHDDGLLYKADNSLYTLTNKPVCVAHPMEMESRDLEEWRKYFNDNKLKQPFEQIWEPVTTSVKNGRYDGCTIALYCLMNKEKHGITMLSQSELRMTDCSASIKLIESHSDWINNVFEIQDFKFDKYTRAVNHIVSIFDKGTVEGRIKKDDISVEPYLERFTIAQIMKFIDIASKNNCNNVLALLMNYKNKHYSDYDPMDEFILDL